MKLTLWQRLNATLIGLILLLMAGFLFELWVVGSNTSADTRRELLGGLRDHIYMDLMRMSDATRGILLDARNDLDRRRVESAQTDLAASFAKFQSTFTNRAELLDSMRQLQNFVLRTNNPFLGRVFEMAETNVTGATA